MKDTLDTNALYTTNHFAEVILPIAIPKPYSYWVPEELQDQVVPGKRVEVQFGRRKLYAGIVLRVGPVDEIPYRAKPILSVLDEAPIVTDIHLQFWQWIADYYLCTIGEVMHAALPASLKLTSETTILLHPDFEDHFEDLDDQEYLIAEALTIRHELSLEDVQGILQIKTIYPIINRLLVKGVLLIKEELQDGYKPKTVDIIQLADAFVTDTNAAFELTARAPKQTETLLHFYQLFREKGRVTREDFHQHPEMQVSNDFMRGGGDGYAVFKDNGMNAYDYGPGLEQVVADYLAANSPYTPYLDGRISEGKAMMEEMEKTEEMMEDKAADTTMEDKSMEKTEMAMAKDDGKAMMAEGGMHEVMAGDNLWNLAKQYYGDGTKWMMIMEANPDINPKNLTIGSKLNVPTAN